MPEEFKEFPGLRYHREFHLLTWHPVGVLDDVILDGVIAFIKQLELSIGDSFNRFSDLSGLVDIKVKFGHAFQIAQHQREFHAGERVKSVLYSERLVGLGMARMYESLMQDGPIDVRVCPTREAAAEWLGVPAEPLQPPEESE